VRARDLSLDHKEEGNSGNVVEKVSVPEAVLVKGQH